MLDEVSLRDPTGELDPVARRRVPRPVSLEGLTVAVLDISKARGDVFLDRLADRFSADGIAVKRFAKPTVARLAPVAVQQAIVDSCHIVVEGLAD